MNNMIRIQKLNKIAGEGRAMVSHHDPGAVEGGHVALEHLDSRLSSLVGGYPGPVLARGLALQD